MALIRWNLLKEKEISVDPKLKEFENRYRIWVEESLPEFLAGKTKKFVERYPFWVYEDVPWTPYRGKASEHKFAIVTTGGVYCKEKQAPFETQSIHGDPSYREIPKAVQQEDLAIAHAHYDHSLAEKDFNCIFPIDRFRELEQEGIIGSLAETHFSFTYVNNIIPLMEQSIPEVIGKLKREDVNALFLVPV